MDCQYDFTYNYQTKKTVSVPFHIQEMRSFDGLLLVKVSAECLKDLLMGVLLYYCLLFLIVQCRQ